MAGTAKPDEPNRAPGSTPQRRTGPKKQAPRPARAAKTQPAGRSALAKGPLGIVLAALTLVETIMGLVVRSSKLAPLTNRSSSTLWLAWRLPHSLPSLSCGFSFLENSIRHPNSALIRRG